MKSFPAMRQGLWFEPPAPPVTWEKLRVGQGPERLFGATRCHPVTSAPVLLPEKKMIRSSRIAPLLLLPLLVAGCSSSESKLEPIASTAWADYGDGVRDPAHVSPVLCARGEFSFCVMET